MKSRASVGAAGARGTPAAKPVLESTLTCPYCGFAKEKVMPLDACLFFHQCWRCNAVMRPKPGDCCVFCSFGSVKCPPVQMHGG